MMFLDLLLGGVLLAAPAPSDSGFISELSLDREIKEQLETQGYFQISRALESQGVEIEALLKAGIPEILKSARIEHAD